MVDLAGYDKELHWCNEGFTGPRLCQHGNAVKNHKFVTTDFLNFINVFPKKICNDKSGGWLSTSVCYRLVLFSTEKWILKNFVRLP